MSADSPSSWDLGLEDGHAPTFWLPLYSRLSVPNILASTNAPCDAQAPWQLPPGINQTKTPPKTNRAKLRLASWVALRGCHVWWMSHACTSHCATAASRIKYKRAAMLPGRCKMNKKNNPAAHKAWAQSRKPLLHLGTVLTNRNVEAFAQHCSSEICNVVLNLVILTVLNIL